MHAFSLAVTMLVIAWCAVFLLALIDRRRGTSVLFWRGGRYHLPRRRRLARWKKIVLFPLGVVLVALLAVYWVIVVPPVFVANLGRRH